MVKLRIAAVNYASELIQESIFRAVSSALANTSVVVKADSETTVSPPFGQEVTVCRKCERSHYLFQQRLMCFKFGNCIETRPERFDLFYRSAICNSL